MMPPPSLQTSSPSSLRTSPTLVIANECEAIQLIKPFIPIFWIASYLAMTWYMIASRLAWTDFVRVVYNPKRECAKAGRREDFFNLNKVLNLVKVVCFTGGAG